MKKIFLTLLIVVVAGVVIYPIATKTAKSKAVTPVTNNTAVLNDKSTTQTVTPSSIKNSKSTKTSNDKIATVSTKNVNSSTSAAVKEVSSTSTAATTKNTSSQSKDSLDTKQSINSQDSLASSNNVNTNIASSNDAESNSPKININNQNNNNSNTSNSSNTKAITNQSKTNTATSKTTQNTDNENNLNATTINSSTFNSSVFNQIKALANPGTAFIANLNSYKIVNGVKYYNVYQYSIGKSSKGWVYDGNYSNFIGARYMSVTGDSLNNQYIQNFDSLNSSQKKSTLYNLAKQFTSYFPDYNANIDVDMNKTKDVDGYHCYLINWGKRSFYINLAGYIFVNKSQSFY